VRAAEVDGVPVQGTCFLGADPGAQAERDVGADPGSFCGFQQRGGLVEGEGSAGSSGSTSKAATATQNHPGNAPSAPSTSSNTASATTPSRRPTTCPAEQKCRICEHHGRTVTRQPAAHIGGYFAVQSSTTTTERIDARPVS
jgi:hypothetical protein